MICTCHSACCHKCRQLMKHCQINGESFNFFRLKRGKLKTRCERKQRNYNGNGWKQTRKVLRVLDLAVVVLVAIPATRQHQLWEILPLYLQILTNPASQPYSKYGYWQGSNHLQKHFLWSVVCLQ